MEHNGCAAFAYLYIGRRSEICDKVSLIIGRGETSLSLVKNGVDL